MCSYLYMQVNDTLWASLSICPLYRMLDFFNHRIDSNQIWGDSFLGFDDLTVLISLALSLRCSRVRFLSLASYFLPTNSRFSDENVRCYKR